MTKLILMLVSVIVLSCTNNKKLKPIKHSESTAANTIDKNWVDSIAEGYVHYFSIGEVSFKAQRHKTDSTDVAVYYKTDTSWQLNFRDQLERGFELGIDINRDGFNDLCNDFRKESVVYLFHPQLKRLVSKPFMLSHQSALIDTINKVYFSNLYIGSTQITDACCLFTIKGYQPQYLYKVTSELIKNDKLNYTLTKFEGEKEVTVRQFVSTLGNYELDYERFWRNYYYSGKLALASRF